MRKCRRLLLPLFLLAVTAQAQIEMTITGQREGVFKPDRSQAKIAVQRFSYDVKTGANAARVALEDVSFTFQRTEVAHSATNTQRATI